MTIILNNSTSFTEYQILSAYVLLWSLLWFISIKHQSINLSFIKVCWELKLYFYFLPCSALKHTSSSYYFTFKFSFSIIGWLFCTLISRHCEDYLLDFSECLLFMSSFSIAVLRPNWVPEWSYHIIIFYYPLYLYLADFLGGNLYMYFVICFFNTQNEMNECL